MSGNSITFKATTDGLVLVLNEKDDFEGLLGKIEKKLVSAGDFFKGADLVVRYRGRDLNEDEKEKLKVLMTEKSGASIAKIEKDRAPSKRSNEANIPPIKKHLYFKGIDEGKTRFYHGTVRSGQVLKFDGNVVVLGDVNPGAQIRAAGNVIVMGSLRGVIHAGIDGNREAVVAAYNLQPTQLRIADVITRSPDRVKKRKYPVPEIALVSKGAVYVEKVLSWARNTQILLPRDADGN